MDIKFILSAVAIALTFYAFVPYIRSILKGITKPDWLFSLSALASIPFWYFTSDPLWAVIILTSVDLLGFGPTIRKAYEFPHQENILFFVLFMVRNAFALLALDNYSMATILFPLSVSFACFFLIIMVSYRRRSVCA